MNHICDIDGALINYRGKFCPLSLFHVIATLNNKPFYNTCDIFRMKTESFFLPKGRLLTTLSALLLFLIAFTIYLPALKNGFVNWDDDKYVYLNTHIRSIDWYFLKWVLTETTFSNWHPLTTLSYAMDYTIWGLKPLGYHLTNNIFHSLNTLLVFILSFKLVKICNHQKAIIAAFVTSLMFAIHPLHVESVAWISERKDVLYAFFYLLAIIVYLEYSSCTKRSKKYRLYMICISLFLFSLLSKPMAVSLPVVLLILDFYPLQRFKDKKTAKKLLTEKIPFFILSVTFSIVTIWAQHAGGALRTVEAYPFITRLFVAIHAYIFYLVKIILPYNLAPLYPHPVKIDPFSIEYAGGLSLFLVICLISIRLIKKNKLILAGWLYYLVTLLPVIGIVQVGGQSAADRYTYLPGLGPFLILGIAVAWLFGKKPVYRDRMALCIVLLISTGITIFITYKQIAIWRDSASLWTHEITIYPDKVPSAYYNRGTFYEKTGNYNKALADLDKAITLKPDDFEAYNNRGNVYAHLGNYRQAIDEYNKVIEINPSYIDAYNSRGFTYYLLRNYQSAIENYNKAIKIDPEDSNAFNNRGLAYLSLGNQKRAIDDLKKAMSLEPLNPKTYYNLALAYQRHGNNREAMINFRKAASMGIKEAEAFVTDYR